MIFQKREKQYWVEWMNQHMYVKLLSPLFQLKIPKLKYFVLNVKLSLTAFAIISSRFKTKKTFINFRVIYQNCKLKQKIKTKTKVHRSIYQN